MLDISVDSFEREGCKVNRFSIFGVIFQFLLELSNNLFTVEGNLKINLFGIDINLELKISTEICTFSNLII